MKFFSFAIILFVLGSIEANHLGTKGLPPSKGGYAPAPPAKGSLPAKGGSPLKGLLKTTPKPAYAPSKFNYRPQVEQRIEQQVVQQQEEELPVQQVLEQVPLESKKPQKIGITRWEQQIDSSPKQYQPRKSILKPEVQKIEQQVVLQQQEPQLLEQAIPYEQKPLAQKPLRYEPQPQPTYQNVRQVPSLFNADAGWD